jgi:hypothetical protein
MHVGQRKELEEKRPKARRIINVMFQRLVNALHVMKLVCFRDAGGASVFVTVACFSPVEFINGRCFVMWDRGAQNTEGWESPHTSYTYCSGTAIYFDLLKFQFNPLTPKDLQRRAQWTL